MENLEIDKLKQEIINLNKIISNDNNTYKLLISELNSKNTSLNNDIISQQS